MSIKEQAARGMLWNSVERFSTQGIQFVLTIVIARVLSPNDYGLVAMLGIFMALAQTMVDSGFGNALIQKKERTEVDYSTTFYFNIVVSLIIYILFFLSAPWIASFYQEPELVKVARIIGIYLITNSFAAVHMARFTIKLNFKKLTFASLISVTLSGIIGIGMAYNGFGVWALVFQSLIGNVAWVISLWIFARWVPKWCFSWSSFHALFSFGSRIMFSNMLHTLYINMYSLVVGKVFSAPMLGYFNRAYTLGQFPVQNLSNVMLKVVYPILCRYQDDNNKFNQILIVYLKISSFIVFPLMIGLVVLAKPVVAILLTEKWLSTAPLLQILCLAMMWLPVMQINVSTVDAKGRSDYHLQSEIFKKLLAIVILVAAIPFGLKGVCLGMLLYSFVDIIIIIAYSRLLTGVGYWIQLKTLLPSLILSLAMGAVVWGMTNLFFSDIAKLFLGSIIGIVFYILLAYLLKFPELNMMYLFFRKQKGCNE